MNVARHHNEWLSLVETSGPFLSLPVLLRVFPQGLDARDPSQASRLREAYEDWLERGSKVPVVHNAWIRHVLLNVLGYPAELLAEGQAIPPGVEAVMATFNETLRPDMVLKHREADQKPVLLIDAYTASQDLQKPVSGRLWKASPGTRMMELLHAADVPVGLVTNGEEWMLVSARRGERTGFASWYADLWMQEPLTLRAFHSLLHLRRLVGVANPDTLPGLLLESSKDQQEVTDQLGYQAREAVEVLVQAFDRIDAESGRSLLAKVGDKTLYDGALTVMMRLVFLFSAEERGLLLLGDPLYDQNYAVSTLSELLRERADQHGEEVLERRHDAWCRLLATFRAVHAGVEHEAMRLPPYGSSLFDPDRYPFLEGRSVDASWQSTVATPLAINNRVVLHLLEALQILRVKVPGGGPAAARRLSFSSLDIEQIGHVYEGLLDHTAKRAHEPIVGLAGSKDKEAEVPLSTLEELMLKGVEALIDSLRDETGRSEKALTRLIQESLGTDEHALLIACGQDERLVQRVKPFASLLRRDSFGMLVVVQTGSVYVTSGSDRRSTGTHYTPRSLTEPIVRYTMEPLVYAGPAEGLPPEEWTLKSPKEILALNVCDMAMGSGAFLVEACRYLAERLAEAWENAEREHPGSFVVTPDGELSTGSPTERLIPTNSAERVAIAMRYVVDRCLYGVDINPMAVEMAKLSLWLITLQRDKPFSFLDHALKCGDSLVGVSSIKHADNFSVRTGERQITFSTAHLLEAVQEASGKRGRLEELPSNDRVQIEAKSRLNGEAETAVERVKGLADLIVAFELRSLQGKRYDDARTLAAADAEASMRQAAQAFRTQATKQLNGRHPFHWPIEFPEVFERGGFDAFVGNPPFMSGHDISGEFGDDYRFWLSRIIYGGKAGLADLCSFFVLRLSQLLRPKGCAGLVATNSIAEGDSRKVALDSLTRTGFSIINAHRNIPWPGTAAVIISPFVVIKCEWKGARFLNEIEVDSINAALQAGKSRVIHSLKANARLCFVGSYILGEGFVLSDVEARDLLDDSSSSKDVLLPYINGVEFNAFPDTQSRRWVICFWDWEIERAKRFDAYFKWIETTVKPVRDKVDRERNRVRWWLHAENRPGLYHAIGLGQRFAKHPARWTASQPALHRVLAKTKTSETWAFGFLPVGIIFDQGLTVIAREEASMLAVAQSGFLEWWTRESGAGTMFKTDQRFSPTMFGGFPLPDLNSSLETIGERFNTMRNRMMVDADEGFTALYKRFHDSQDTSSEIHRLRTAHVEIDNTVAAAYGLGPLDLGHDFHRTKHGLRFTFSDSARHTVLDRLLALNHQRYAEEVKAGLHGEGAKKQGKAKTRPAPGSASPLFG